jgi:hypothetical protein
MEKSFKASITIEGLANIFGVKVNITPIVQNKELLCFSVYLSNVEVAEDGFIISVSGRGKTIIEAEKDYFTNISGKELRINNNGTVFYSQMPRFKQ